jgi:hypothetical protein
MWHSNISAIIMSIETNSRRLCAVLVTTKEWNLVLINAYMPYEDDDIKSSFCASSELLGTYNLPLLQQH